MINKTFIKILSGLTIIVSAYSSLAAGGSMMMGIAGTLKNTEKAIRASVLRAEEIYEQNGGAPLLSAIDLLTTGNNPFLNSIQVDVNYGVRITFAGAVGSPSSFADNADVGSNATIPVAQALNGRVIHLIPIMGTGDSSITTWECITNIDDGVNVIMGGDSSATSGNISFIARPEINQGNVYISNCIFVSGYAFS